MFLPLTLFPNIFKFNFRKTKFDVKNHFKKKSKFICKYMRDIFHDIEIHFE